jgi:HEPN domain-containing protein
MEQAEHIAYWLKSAEHDLQSAETLFQHQRYDWCLFLGHLIIEKVLKAFFVRDNPNVKEMHRWLLQQI